jgi:peptide/nickel transport system ATP-binding protein
MENVIEVTDLRTYFETGEGVIRAVDGVDLHIEAGETLGVVGESGCGKTVLALSIMRLIPSPPGRIVSGMVCFEGQDLLTLSSRDLCSIRGRKISMIFQEPMTSLNPVIRIGDQIVEAMRLHLRMSRRDARERALAMLQRVGMPSAAERLNDYPHQMSGGMRQRVMIAMALSCDPKLMIADEPTTALDVTIQAQILDLITRLKETYHTAVLLITHDLGVIAEAAQKVMILYAGQVVERCSVSSLFSNPLHPYSIGLMESRPRCHGGTGSPEELKAIPGGVPSLYTLPVGCTFQDRCPDVMKVCRGERPGLAEIGTGHFVRCWKKQA